MMQLFSNTNLPANFLLCDRVDSKDLWRYEFDKNGCDSCLDFFESSHEDMIVEVKPFEIESEDKCNELFIKLINSVPHSTFKDIASAKDFFHKNKFPCGYVLCGVNFTDEFLFCFEFEQIFRTSLIDDNIAFLFSLPQFVGAMPHNSKYFGMAIVNKDSFCRIVNTS
jgi:hypothetical protein